MCEQKQVRTYKKDRSHKPVNNRGVLLLLIIIIFVVTVISLFDRNAFLLICMFSGTCETQHNNTNNYNNNILTIKSHVFTPVFLLVKVFSLVLHDC